MLLQVLVPLQPRNKLLLTLILSSGRQFKLYQRYINLLYANVITTLETYLFDTFVKLATGNGQYTDKYIILKKEKKFKCKKIKSSELYFRKEKIDKDNVQYLSSLNWHNLNKVEKEYHTLIGISFSTYKTALNNSIQMRHDIVHRNGKKKDGTKIVIKKPEVIKLINLCRKFVNYLHPLIESKVFDLEERYMKADRIIDDSPY